jgi:hypothetical protein
MNVFAKAAATTGGGRNRYLETIVRVTFASNRVILRETSIPEKKLRRQAKPGALFRHFISMLSDDVAAIFDCS